MDFLSLFPPNTVFFLNHSGGKDSQSMHARLSRLLPKENLIVIHAHLPGVEWEGTVDFIKDTIGDYELRVVQAKKTFFQMVHHRKMFPSPKNRQCTSDLKRGPIEKEIRRICNERGFTTVVNCMGLRAEESSGRSKKEVFKKNERNSTKDRAWFDWLPIHKKSASWVFKSISAAGQKPFWIYAAGMTRKSCKFCIMSSDEDICTAAKLSPEGAELIMEFEALYDHTLLMPSKKKGKRYLKDIINPAK